MSTYATNPAPYGGEPFPTAICVATTVLTGLGLAAAGGNLHWFLAPSQDALNLAWLYVNLCLAAVWFLVWPALRLREKASMVRPLLWDIPAILICSIPALGVAAWLSELPLAAMGKMLFLQFSFGLFARGLLHLRSGKSASNAAISGLLAVLFLGGPLLVYLHYFAFPALSTPWEFLCPPLAIEAAAQGLTASAASGLWLVGGIYMGAGVVLLSVPRWLTAA